MTVEIATKAWRIWHYSWAAAVVGSLLLHMLWPLLGLSGPSSPGYWAWALSLIVYPMAAAVILVNRPGNRVGRILATVTAAAGVIFVGSWAVTTWQDQTWTLYLEAVSAAAPPIMFWGVITLLFIFPTGTITRPVFRIVFSSFTFAVAVIAILGILSPDPLQESGRPNPLAGPAWVAKAYATGINVLLPALLAGGWASLSRYRHASAEVRLQLRWFLLGIVAVAALIAVVGFIPETLPSPWEELTLIAIVAGFWALPLSIVVAVTRYRLYEIDRLLSRTITYTMVVGMLGGTYLGSVAVISGLVPTQDSLAVAASTLAVAALFNPLRRRVQRLVDRRFNRIAYRAEAVSEELARKLLEPRPGDQLAEVWRGTVAEVFQPSGIGVWLPDEEPRAADPHRAGEQQAGT